MVHAGSRQTVTITPARGSLKAPITISGSGFRSGEEIEIVLNLGEGQLIGLGTRKSDVILTDSNGAFSVKSHIPKMAKPGDYDIEVEGNKGSYGRTTLKVVKKK
jgi:hypothetical protein